mgnify:FL=1
MKKVILVLVLLLMPVICLSGEHEEAIKKKKAAIQEIMSQGQFKVHNKDNQQFCAAFLQDFTEQKGIEHIKPIVEVDDYKDTKLQKYLKRCPKEEFHKTVWVEPRQMYEHEREYYATKNFKLFEVNIDNNSKNGDEYVFYAEGYKDSGNNYTYGGYSVIDLKKCRSKGGVHTIDPYDYEKNKSIENYNGIIKYKGEYYIFELNNYAGRMLELNKYIEKRNNMKRICLYYKKK